MSVLNFLRGETCEYQRPWKELKFGHHPIYHFIPKQIQLRHDFFLFNHKAYFIFLVCGWKAPFWWLLGWCRRNRECLSALLPSSVHPKEKQQLFLYNKASPTEIRTISPYVSTETNTEIGVELSWRQIPLNVTLLGLKSVKDHFLFLVCSTFGIGLQWISLTQEVIRFFPSPILNPEKRKHDWLRHFFLIGSTTNLQRTACSFCTRASRDELNIK